MKFLADENVDSPIVERLRKEVFSAYKQGSGRPVKDDKNSRSKNAASVRFKRPFGLCNVVFLLPMS